jgi:predicted RNA binding protein YcfA (HicA-like mRNA interferase family)
LKQVSGREFAKVVERRGWGLARINGSHHIYTKDGERARIVIPIHGSKPLRTGLLRSLMKLAGIEEADL